MKKIEAIINRKNYPTLREKLDALGIDIIDKRNLEDSKFISESKGSRAGGTGLRSTMLAKIELAMQDKDARGVLEIISKNSGLPKSIKSKIFVFDMQESIDLSTLEGKSDVEAEEKERVSVTQRFTTKRNRLIPLQKRTLYKLEQYYDENREILESDYRIRSFTDFVNYCILKYLPTLDKQLKNSTMLYEDIL
ncbi:MAG: transcriptional regulator [Candidatus Nitrosopelagicus sp.]|jgi:nitrogen regulatory protein P-II 1|nr:transcriptional regulator [Candidatus Nitrosopelagicus sp.]MDP6898660.1 transcriptional regulator [Candidatus Nitrosopelagicus sp.]|tara:strand:- start:2242 stop:2820 length:579 start_codon:yes stop_codon:yes gene_type:complete